MTLTFVQQQRTNVVNRSVSYTTYHQVQEKTLTNTRKKILTQNFNADVKLLSMSLCPLVSSKSKIVSSDLYLFRSRTKCIYISAISCADFNSFDAKFQTTFVVCVFLTNYRLEISLYIKLKDWMSNSVDPYETAHYEPSHLDLRCLEKPIIRPIAYDSERVKCYSPFLWSFISASCAKKNLVLNDKFTIRSTNKRKIIFWVNLYFVKLFWRRSENRQTIFEWHF